MNKERTACENVTEERQQLSHTQNNGVSPTLQRGIPTATKEKTYSLDQSPIKKKYPLVVKSYVQLCIGERKKNIILGRARHSDQPRLCVKNAGRQQRHTPLEETMSGNHGRKYGRIDGEIKNKETPEEWKQPQNVSDITASRQ